MTAPTGILMFPETSIPVSGSASFCRTGRWSLSCEPELSVGEPIELIATRDYLPYIVGLGGWIVAIIVVLVR